jgi:ribose-phosphate pyrophosphokinase
MLELAGADRVITVDLHASQVQGFVRYPIDNLYAMPLMYDYIKDNIGRGHCDDLVIVSPDAGGAKRAETLSKKLGADLAIFSKKREKANEVSCPALMHPSPTASCSASPIALLATTCPAVASI